MGARVNWENAPVDEREKDGLILSGAKTNGQLANRRNDYNPCMTFEDGRPSLNVDQSLALDSTSACSWGNLHMPSSVKTQGSSEATWCCLAKEDKASETLDMEEMGKGK